MIKSQILLKALYLEATLTFLRFAAKHCSIIAQLLGGSYQLYAATCCTSKFCRGKLFNRKRKPPTMFEKRLKINKFANYQNTVVRNSPALDCHVFVPAKPLISISFPESELLCPAERATGTSGIIRFSSSFHWLTI